MDTLAFNRAMKHVKFVGTADSWENALKEFKDGVFPIYMREKIKLAMELEEKGITGWK